MGFKNIRKVLDDFETVMKKSENNESLTREEEATIWYSNLRLAEALLRDWSNAERVATMILTESEMLEEVKVKFNNPEPKKF